MKKLISGIVLISLFLYSIPVFAVDTAAISYQDALQKLTANSIELKKIKSSEDRTNKREEDVEEKVWKRYWKVRKSTRDDYQRMLLVRERDMELKQSKYDLMQVQNNRRVTEKKLANNLRDVYLNLLDTDFTMQIMSQRVAVEEKKYQQDVTRYELGVISQLELEESEYNYQKAKQEEAATTRSCENAVRSFNQFIGEPISTKYARVVFDDGFNYKKLQPLDHYIEKALKERVEISNIEAQIEMKKFEMSILEENDIHRIYRLARIDYARLKSEADSLQVKLEQTRVDIEKSIKSAYIDMQKNIADITGIENTLESQKQLLSKMKEQRSLGARTDIEVKEMEINIAELENNLLLSIYNANTTYQKLESAAGYGPGY